MSRHDPQPGSAGDVLTLISAGSATTRSDLARLTGLARSTISQRVDALIERGLVEETESGESTGGRPPRQLRLHTEKHAFAGVDLGATHCRMSLMDISGNVLAECEDALHIGEGPDNVLAHVDQRLDHLLGQAGRPARHCARSASGCRGRWSSPRAGRTTRRSCPAGTTTPSPTTSRASRSWWTTTST
ncbi:MarR family transcriptional regulator [Nonomuraea antimicrobica]